MNREIKFRQYNKKHKRMYYDANFPFDGNEVSMNEQIKLSQGVGTIWMQFTGLKDKNGKEIYEGDIVKIDDVCYPIKIVSYTAGIINEHDGDFDEWYCGFDLGIYGDECNVLHYQLTDKVEVIGNIYENPELLKE